MVETNRFRHREGPFRRFLGHRDGSVAVELSIVLVPFLAIIGATIDMAFTTWVSINLTNGLNDAARTIQTGQFQKTNSRTTDTTQLLTAFRDQLCKPSGTSKQLLFVDCANIKVQVQTCTSLTQCKADAPLDTTTKQWSNSFGTKYSQSGASTYVVAQAGVKVPVLLNILNVTQSFADGSRLVEATTVFRTEPFN